MSLLSHTAVVGLLVSLVSFAAHPLPSENSAYPPPKLTELRVVSKSSLGGQIGSMFERESRLAVREPSLIAVIVTSPICLVGKMRGDIVSLRKVDQLRA